MQIVHYNNEYISKLSLGTVQFGLDYGVANKSGQPEVEEVKKIVDFVLDSGVNCFDTASAYGNSEEVLGKVLNGNAQYLVSKLKSENFTDNLLANINESLKKLKVKSLYGLLLHDSKLLYKWEDTYTKQVGNLIKTSKIKYFGVSIYSDEDFLRAIENDSISIIQIPFSIFDQRATAFDWLKKAKEKNKLIFIRSIYLQGLILMDKNTLPSNLTDASKYISIFERYCRKLNMTKNELALSYVNSVAKNSVILFGCDNVLQAKENISTFNNLPILSSEIIDKLNKSFVNVPEYIYNPTKWL